MCDGNYVYNIKILYTFFMWITPCCDLQMLSLHKLPDESTTTWIGLPSDLSSRLDPKKNLKIFKSWIKAKYILLKILNVLFSRENAVK